MLWFGVGLKLIDARGVKAVSVRRPSKFEVGAPNGVPIPKPFLQELLSYYSRNDDYPNGINMDDPFELPADIERIDVGEGRAVIIQ